MPKKKNGSNNSSSKLKPSEQVLEFARKKKSFTTGDVEEHFKIEFNQAVARIAILSLRKLVEPQPRKQGDETNRWQYVGS